jgi:valyl-tRNA synthetase
VIRTDRIDPRAASPDFAATDTPARLPPIEIWANPHLLRERYARQIVKLEDEVARLERKLGNLQFIEKAKPDVVAGERAKLATYGQELERVRASLAAIPPGDETKSA